MGYCQANNIPIFRGEVEGGAARELLTAGLARNFERIWRPLPRAEMDEELESEVARLAPEFLKEEWLYKIGRRMEGQSDFPLSS